MSAMYCTWCIAKNEKKGFCSKIREELHLERNRASRQEQRANDLDIIVENIKHKIRQLEDESIAKVCQQQNQVKELQKDQQASQVLLL